MRFCDVYETDVWRLTFLDIKENVEQVNAERQDIHFEFLGEQSRSPHKTGAMQPERWRGLR